MDTSDVEEQPMFCLMQASPFVVHKAAGRNDVKQLNALLEEDPSRITKCDDKGWTVLHRAAFNGANDTLSVILTICKDIDEVTGDGETALHLAVRSNQCETIEVLVARGASGEIKNKKSFTPLHLAVQLGNHEALKSLLKSGKLKADVAGELNMTPLHLAASMDDLTSTKILLDHGSYMCRSCSLGLTGLHYAAKNASKNVLNLMLELAESKGYTREYLLSAQDKYKNSPLHSAINSGNTEPVRVCLEAGAKICSKQSDGSTSVHLVCSQGVLNIVKLMNETQPDEFQRCLSTQDDNGMTPLHRAVLFNYHDLACYLVKSKSPLDMKDCNGKTPLLLASFRLNLECVKVLYDAGADVTARDMEQSNLLHLAIKSATGLEDLWTSSPIKNISTTKLMNQTDIHGCTPIHYASKDGNLSSLTGLLSQGAVITCKDNSKQSPLHFASMYGRVNTCRTLLDTAEGSFVINEANHEGKTALHVAAEFGHVKVVALLMQRGALLHRDHQGNSPLHLAAKNGYTQTTRLLLNVHPSLLNSINNAGNTPLHEAAITNRPKSISLLLSMEADVLKNKESRTFLDLAIEQANSDAALAVVSHDRWNEILLSPSHAYGTYMIGLIKHLPEVARSALNRCTETSSHDPNSAEYNVTYHFDLIRPSESEEFKKITDDDGVVIDTSASATLMSMVKHERVQCLSHPVCLRYVRYKWDSIGIKIHSLNVLLYLLFLSCFTASIVQIGPSPLQLRNVSANNSWDNGEVTVTMDGEQYQLYQQRVRGNYPQLIVIAILICCNIIKEILQLVQAGRHYFLDITNYLEWLIYISAALYTIPTFLKSGESWPYECGVVSLFFAWFNLLFFLQRYEFFGIYVVMFRGILKTLLQVLVVFSIIVFAFGFTFYALLRDEKESGFTSIGLSFFTSIVMMVGELSYIDTFVLPRNDGNDSTLRFQSMAFFMLSLFLLLMPILLMNLLIGLAVGDIDSVLKNARLRRLAMQVELLAEMEEKLPEWISKRFDKNSLTVYPNDCATMLTNFYESLVRGSDSESAAPEKNELQETVLQQKARIKELQSEMKTQTELLRLVVEKMEIKTESSFLDEGSRDEKTGISLILKQASMNSSTWQNKSVTDAMSKVKAVNTFTRQLSRCESRDTNLKLPPPEETEHEDDYIA